jgi:hypothetical protein
LTAQKSSESTSEENKTEPGFFSHDPTLGHFYYMDNNERNIDVDVLILNSRLDVTIPFTSQRRLLVSAYVKRFGALESVCQSLRSADLLKRVG